MKKKVLIIGAGIAGLAAANRLLEHDHEVTVLEARARPGGRIWDDDIFGIPLARGATWIHGITDNPITELAIKYNAKFLPFDLNKYFVFDSTSREIPRPEITKFNEKLAEKLNQAQEFACEASEDMPLSSALSLFYPTDSLTGMERDAFKLKKNFFECYVGAGYEHLSARNWDQEESLPGANCILVDGYRSIIQGLSKNCAIIFNAIVQQINERATDIEVVTDKESYYADYVIVTLPLGVLKKNTVKFNPPLPAFKQTAINNLEMGLLNLTALKFPKQFWQQDSHALFFCMFESPASRTFVNFSHFVDQPILFANTGGETALQLEKYSDQELLEKNMQNLRQFYGNAIPEPDGFYTTRWQQDPFSFGSYSYIAVGGSGDDYDRMAQPISERIFFAGEATHRQFPATTHGAYLSGIREAERVVNYLSSGEASTRIQ